MIKPPVLFKVLPYNLMTHFSVENHLANKFKQQLNEQIASLKIKVKEQQDQITQLEQLIEVITQEIASEKIYDC